MVNFDPHLLERLGVALAIGLLIGMERGWERRDVPKERTRRDPRRRSVRVLGPLETRTLQRNNDRDVEGVGRC
jgi:hypothetical protein